MLETILIVCGGAALMGNFIAIVKYIISMRKELNQWKAKDRAFRALHGIK